MIPNLRSADDPVVKAALTHKCECGADPGVPCSSVTSKPFVDGRLVHFARIREWDASDKLNGDNE